ncbi:MAG: tRNA glutamyl-Q(34) synthetase GluQRS [Steroidobacteraceae bacterium]
MVVTRFAPSPTGRLHLGHAYSAAIGHARARALGGRFRLRIEDLDQVRCQPEFMHAIIDDLRWLGIAWDEPVLIQSQRSSEYEAVLDRLKSLGLVFACFCTRADLAQSLTAPHGDAALAYPGTCRELHDDPKRRAEIPHSWRLNCAKAVRRVGLPSWTEVGGQEFAARAQDIGDAIVARKDAPASYHLSCAVDDAATGVTMVVRGVDLRPSTPVQRLLQLVLDLPEPTYFHHQLVVHEDGRRLAKRDRAPTLAGMRDAGFDGPSLAERLCTDELPSGFRLSAA